MERSGHSLLQALFAFLLDPRRPHHERGAAGKLLAINGNAVQALLGLFSEQFEKTDLHETALMLEELNDIRAVPTLIYALLQDPNPHRRHAAARALDWIRPSTRSAALALAKSLVDSTQFPAVREEAAESLASVGSPVTIDALISEAVADERPAPFWR